MAEGNKPRVTDCRRRLIDDNAWALLLVPSLQPPAGAWGGPPMNQTRLREQDEPALDWQVPVLLERAVAIARDVAIGDTGIAPVVIALRPGQPPVTLFIESDQDPASADCLAAAIDAFLTSAGATAWLRLDECVSEIVAGDQPADRLVCTAGTRSPEGTTEDTLLLGIERDARG